MKGILYYFSGTGNTKWAAERFSDYFKLYGINIEIVNLEKESFMLGDHDFTIIGTPIYFAEVPRIVSNFIASIPQCNDNKRFLIFSTSSGKSSGTLDMLSAMPKEKGYSIASQVNIIMPSDFKHNKCGNALNENDIINLTEKASCKIKNVVKDFLTDKTTIEKASSFSIAVARFMKVMNSSKRMHMVKYLDCTTDCIRCGLCLRNCPCGNITFNNGSVVFHSNCIMCMRCIYICPQKAITYKGLKSDGLSGVNLRELDIL